MGLEKEAVNSVGAPEAIGPYSQAVRAGSFIFLSGQIGLDPASGEMVPGGVAEQMRRVIDNIRAVLDAGGSSMDRVVRTTIYLREMGDFKEVNAVYGESFGEPYPARATVAVAGLPLDARVEMDVVALCR